MRNKLEIGSEAEELAAYVLELEGYKVLERHVKQGYDMLAEKDGKKFYVEVKSGERVFTFSRNEVKFLSSVDNVLLVFIVLDEKGEVQSVKLLNPRINTYHPAIEYSKRIREEVKRWLGLHSNWIKEYKQKVKPLPQLAEEAMKETEQD